MQERDHVGGGAECSNSVNCDCHQAQNKVLVGIKDDVEKLVEKLTMHHGEEDHDHDHDLDVLAIIGMGGSGKTTLARNIYNHPKVKKHFSHQAWVSLTPEWTVDNVMSEIANQINNKISMIDAREPDQNALGTMMRNLIDGLAAFFLNGLRTIFGIATPSKTPYSQKIFSLITKILL